jgi:hypothetical protein
VDGAADRPVVGLFGGWDTGNLGEVALRRVIEGELRRRRPDIEVVPFAPFGAEHPIPGDEGRPARPLAAVAERSGLGADALIISGDVLAGDAAWSRRYPTAQEHIAERGVAALALAGTRAGLPAADQVSWFAVGVSDDPDVDLSDLEGRDVWVRNRRTQERLGGDAALSGDPLLLASSVFGGEVLRKRADLLRLCGALTAGRRLVVEVTGGFDSPDAARHLSGALDGALRSDPALSVIVLSLDPAALPPETILRVEGVIAERVHHFPAWASLDDVAAAMSGAAVVLATSPAGAHLATGLRAPTALVGTGAADRTHPGIPVFAADLPAGIAALLSGGSPTEISETVDTLDAAFAALADRLPMRSALTSATRLHDPVDSAIAILQQRLVDERTALEAELSRLQAELEHLQASPEHRLARPFREAYRRWQRRRT